MKPTAARPATDFQRFEALTRRILTTPKAELMKGAKSPKAKPAKQASKRKAKR
jgi:hypothetical protein